MSEMTFWKATPDEIAASTKQIVAALVKQTSGMGTPREAIICTYNHAMQDAVNALRAIAEKNPQHTRVLNSASGYLEASFKLAERPVTDPP